MNRRKSPLRRRAAPNCFGPTGVSTRCALAVGAATPLTELPASAPVEGQAVLLRVEAGGISVKVTASLERRPADRHAAAPDGAGGGGAHRERIPGPSSGRDRRARTAQGPAPRFTGAGTGRSPDEGAAPDTWARAAAPGPAGRRCRSRSRRSGRGGGRPRASRRRAGGSGAAGGRAPGRSGTRPAACRGSRRFEHQSILPRTIVASKRSRTTGRSHRRPRTKRGKPLPERRLARPSGFAPPRGALRPTSRRAPPVSAATPLGPAPQRARTSMVHDALRDPVRELGALLLDQVADLDENVAGLEDELRERARDDEQAVRLMSIPGIGPLTAMASQASRRRWRASGATGTSRPGWAWFRGSTRPAGSRSSERYPRWASAI